MRRNHRGTAAVELIILTPVLLLIIAWIVAFARISVAGESVTSAAGAAARAAALERTARAARSVGEQMARASLTSHGLKCSSVQVSVDTSGFDLPVGQKAAVTATVTCIVPFGDLGLPIQGTRAITETATVPLDTYRGRGR